MSSVWKTHAMKKTSKATKKNIIGARVREARLKLKPAVSQDDLAGRLAGQGILMDRSAVSRIENQSRYAMDYEAAAIARALKVSVAWLFAESD
jgi:transcriptional regulator with XRE-family HTH domain